MIYSELSVKTLVKIYLLLIICITGTLLSLTLSSAFSEMQPNNNLILQGSGLVVNKKNMANSDLEFIFSPGNPVNGKTFLTIQGGMIFLSGENYLVSNGATATMLRDGNFIALLGNAQNSNGDKIQVNLFGRLVQTNSAGSVYLFTGKITHDIESWKVSYSTKLSSAMNEITSTNKTEQKPTTSNLTSSTITKPETPTKSEPVAKIIIIAKQSSPVRISYSYSINVKVYYADRNPTKDFDQSFGFVPNAMVRVQISDSNANLIKSFEGLTNDHGFYSETFRIPDNFPLGTYAVNVTAHLGNVSDNQKLVLVVQQHYN